MIIVEIAITAAVILGLIIPFFGILLSVTPKRWDSNRYILFLRKLLNEEEYRSSNGTKNEKNNISNMQYNIQEKYELQVQRLLVLETLQRICYKKYVDSKSSNYYIANQHKIALSFSKAHIANEAIFFVPSIAAAASGIFEGKRIPKKSIVENDELEKVKT